MVQNIESDPDKIALLFLQIFKKSLERMEPQPQDSAYLLYTITFYSNELFNHFNNENALNILRDRAKSLKVEDIPLTPKIIKSD